MLDFLAPRLSPAYRDCKVPLLLVTMLGDFVQGQWRCLAAVSIASQPRGCKTASATLLESVSAIHG